MSIIFNLKTFSPKIIFYNFDLNFLGGSLSGHASRRSGHHRRRMVVRIQRRPRHDPHERTGCSDQKGWSQILFNFSSNTGQLLC